ncbi:hypothetical protein MD484_g4051, partial [Candolleomyces efflorescens]
MSSPFNYSQENKHYAPHWNPQSFTADELSVRIGGGISGDQHYKAKDMQINQYHFYGTSPEKSKPSPVAAPEPELLPLFDKDHEPISSDLDDRLGKAIGAFSFAAFDRLIPESIEEQTDA